jgi:hypothetical protein
MRGIRKACVHVYRRSATDLCPVLALLDVGNAHMHVVRENVFAVPLAFHPTRHYTFVTCGEVQLEKTK